MKSLNLFFMYLMGLILSFNLYSCSEEKEITPEPTPVKPAFAVQNTDGTVFSNSITPTYLGNTYNLKVKSTVKWEAQVTCEGDWITLDPTSADGTKECTLTVAANDKELADTRSGKVVFTPLDESLSPFEISISQGAKPFSQEAYFISPTGAGTKDGTTWENAMDIDGFMSLFISPDVNLAEYPIYLMEGTYAPTISIAPTKNVKLISGGYSSQSTGVDLTKKSTEPTIITGSDQLRIFNIYNVSVKMENITLTNGKAVSADQGTGIYILGSAENTVEIDNCIVRNCSTESTAWESGAITMGGSLTVKLNNVSIVDNVGRTRGAGIHLIDRNTAPKVEQSVRLFMNNCHMSGNKVDGTIGDAWGIEIGIRAGEHKIYMNNTTIIAADNYDFNGNNKQVVAGDAPIFAVNSTFVGNSQADNVVRVNSDVVSAFINCLFVNNGCNGNSLSSSAKNQELSLGWNVYSKYDFTANENDTDASGWTFNGRKDEGVYKWTVDDNLKKFATLDGVTNAFSNVEGAQDFIDWVNTKGGFDKDQLGNARNTDKMQPGAYDAYLN